MLPNSPSLARILSIALMLGGLLAPATADEPSKKKEDRKKPTAQQQALVKDRYIRVVKKDGKPIALETSVIRFAPEPGSPLAQQGVTVDLIGAVHIGEGSYYQQLNQRFQQYDAMLFELVAPEGTVIPKGGGDRKGGNPISALQGGMKDLLDLEFQLEKVDYTKANFVHADMSPQEMKASMKKRGESVLQMFFRMMGHGFAQQAKGGGPSDVELLVALFAKDRARRMKRIMAAQIVDMEALNAALAGPDGSNTLIGERNRKALEVMSREVKAGKKKLAIFYGAGHLPDFERRMKADHKLKPVGVQWLTAWDLK